MNVHMVLCMELSYLHQDKWDIFRRSLHHSHSWAHGISPILLPPTTFRQLYVSDHQLPSDSMDGEVFVTHSHKSFSFAPLSDGEESSVTVQTHEIAKSINVHKAPRLTSLLDNTHGFCPGLTMNEVAAFDLVLVLYRLHVAASAVSDSLIADDGDLVL
mmetsp:Transcript_34246/g.70115  ORF Transcript_34246/g.70115 Transcript_34246/m.70115 type:complete len:158 (+) Transcript_34246:5683-6156(+)